MGLLNFTTSVINAKLAQVATNATAIFNNLTSISNNTSNISDNSDAISINSDVISGNSTDIIAKADKNNVIEKDSTSAFTPTADTHPVNKVYVDNAISGLGGDMNKAVYDPNIIGADAFSMNNMVETSTKKILTDTERDKIGKFSYSGVAIAPSFTDNANGSITIGTGTYRFFPSSDFTGALVEFEVIGNTFTLTNNTINYLVANYNSGSPIIEVITNVALITTSDILPILTIARTDNDLVTLDWNTMANGLANKMTDRLVKTNRFTIEQGLTLSANGLKALTSAGTVWYGSKKALLDEIDTALINNDIWLFENTNGTWTHTIVNDLNNTQYNDLTTGFQLLSNNKYNVSWVFRTVDSSKTRLGIVLSTGNYSLSEAQSSAMPELPNKMAVMGIFIGRIIVQKDATTSYSVEPVQDVALAYSQVSDHNNLVGIQGGTVDEYYHLTSAEKTKVEQISVTQAVNLDTMESDISEMLSGVQQVGDAIKLDGSLIGEFLKSDYLSGNVIADCNLANTKGVTIYEASDTTINKPYYTSKGILLSFSYDSVTTMQVFLDWEHNIAHIRELTDTWHSWDIVWTKGTDGAGSGLDADKLDDHESDYFATQADMTNVETDIATNTAALLELTGEQYTIRWNKTTDSYTRLNLALGKSVSDFNNFYPWSEMKRCNLADDLTVNDYYGDTNYIEDGTNGEVMVQIPKFYYKTEFYNDGTNDIREWSVSKLKLLGFKLHPAFIDNGIEKDYFYISAYEGYNSGGTLKSIIGVQPTASQTINTFRTQAQVHGNGWGLLDYMGISAIQMLYLIEYADMFSQNVLSNGITNLASGTANHSQNTGHTSSLGNLSGEVTILEASLENGATGGDTHPFSYRGIENFYGNIYKFIDGILIKDDGYYIGQDIDAYSDVGTNYLKYNTIPITTNGYSKDFENLANMEYSFMPNQIGGSSTTYITDYLYAHDIGEINIALFGGFWVSGAYAGCFSWSLCSVASNLNRYVGARLLAR